MLGADYILSVDPAHEIASDILNNGADRLLLLFSKASRADWLWFEAVLAYDNCRMPEAMIRAGMRLDRPDVADCGMRAMRWVFARQAAPEGHFRPVGSESFGRDYVLPMPFDQQPVEIWAAIDGAAAAFDASGDPIWLVHAQCAYDWFGGKNDRGIAVGDPVSGSCHDGINPRGVNFNEGAESVLSYQLATCAMRELASRIG